MSENWDKEIAKEIKPEEFMQKNVYEPFFAKCKNHPQWVTMNDLWHHNQSDAVITAPNVMYLGTTGSFFPHPEYVDIYLLCAWLGMNFLHKEKLSDLPNTNYSERM